MFPSDASPPDALFDEQPEFSLLATAPADEPRAPRASGAAPRPAQQLLERVAGIFPGRLLAFVPADVDEEDNPRVALASAVLAPDDDIDPGGSE